jgi:predicted DNA-binding transcriptional regulator YafY
MAWNKKALIRYRTIDKCLQNHSRKWTLENIIEECSNVLYELEGKDVQISKRTIQLDIQLMRSDKLGYNAPIQVYEKKYYCYSDLDFSITDIPLTKVDMDVLTESVEMLKQFKKFSLFNELNGVIQKLEDKVFNESANRKPIIHIDKNENLKGLELIDTLYQAILKRVVLKITYQSFSAKSPNTFNFHGYILKEFNNRWFLVGRRDGLPKVRTLALDRMIKVDIDLSVEYEQENFEADTFYSNTYGVTVLSDDQLIEIEMKIDRYNAPYVLTKPFHSSQHILNEFEDGSVSIGLKVHHNFEIERLLIGFSESIEILKPASLRKRLRDKFEMAYLLYEKNDGIQQTI